MFIIIALTEIIIGVISFLEYLLMGYIILGWFVFFGAIKDRNGLFFKIYAFLVSKIEPILSMIRRILPSIGVFDFSPFVVFLCLHFAKALIIRLFFALAYG
ncbi:MAG: YggT family protein [Holosporales bacterium]|jgi:uncharacterized protein YggT (Ycf19 family)|nr:YggT family protein [Holosporales bacterium]